MPTAVLTPGTTRTSPLGTTVILDGRASIGTALSYSWAVSGPIGSRVTSVKVTEAGLAKLYPDIPGPYEVTLTVTEGTDSSSTSEKIIAHASQVSPLVQTPPNASYIKGLISDFWSLTDNYDALPVLWSGYTQILASDFLRAYQADSDKSIQTIQPLSQKRWLSYSPALSLESGSIFLGQSQSGTNATTAITDLPIEGTVISGKEFRITAGEPSSTVSSITLGTTSIAVKSAGTGYVGDFSSLFAPQFSGTTLNTIAGSRIVFASGADFATVAEGSALLIPKGTNAGLYLITRTINSVDTTGIPSSAFLEVDRPLWKTTANTYQITTVTSAVCTAGPLTLTDTVYVPQDALNPSVYEISLSGTGQISRDLFTPEPRNYLPELVGKDFWLTQEGTSTAIRATVVDLAPDGKSFLISSQAALTGSYQYEFRQPFSIRDRLLCIEQRAHKIRNIQRLTNHWAIQLAGSFEVSGRSNLEWRITHTIALPDTDDMREVNLAAQGVCAGDLLYLAVKKLDTAVTSLIPCQVVGTAGNMLSFELGTTTLTPGVAGSLTEAEKQEIIYALGVRDVLIAEDAPITLAEALRIQAEFFLSGEFAARHYNIPISENTQINIDDVFFAQLTASLLIRNKRIPALTAEEVEDGFLIKSIPTLTEYVATPDTETGDEGTVRFTVDGEATLLARPPISLAENKDFIVEGDLVGFDAATSQNSEVVTLPFAALTKRDVQPGDSLILGSRYGEIAYVIREVLGDTTVRVSTRTGRIPEHSETKIRFRIRRQVAGTFIRFVGAFTPDNAAPTSLWAQTVLFDNAKTVEENFGPLVGYTRKLHEDYGVSQSSYDVAVRALMFGWVTGPTISNIHVGSHIYLAQPVTETDCIITDIDTDLSADSGQIIVENLSPAGTFKIYRYRKSAYSLPEFSGLAQNPRTGKEFAIGDIVPALTPLTKNVQVSDRLTDPELWLSGGKNQLTKYHSWDVSADLAVTDSRDMDSLAGFLTEIRPIYTKPTLIGVLFLRDEVSTEVGIHLHGTLRLNDTPAFDLESSYITDSYNESSASTRLLDLGTFITRTLFEGDDLVMTAGSATVSSARGGFTSPITFINHKFPAPITTVGEDLVAPGDILWVRTGENSGRYEVVTVVSNTQLTVSRAQDAESIDLPPRSMDPENFVAAENCVFQIQRRTTESDSLSLTELTDSGTDFRVERLFAKDVIAIDLTPDALFTIVGTQASCSVDLEAAGIIAGDVFIIADSEYAITAVSAGDLSLATAPSVSSGIGTIRRSV